MKKKYTKSIVPGYSKLPGQGNPFTDSKGEINASSTKDLIAQITNTIHAYENKSFTSIDDEVTASERKELLLAALSDRSGNQMRILGEATMREIEETTTREGFVRRVMKFDEVAQGEILQIPIKDFNVTGFTAVSMSEVTPNIIRKRSFLPPEFHIPVYIVIDTIEIAQSPTDLLEEKYEQGLEAIMVQEDRLWKTMVDNSVGYYNEVQSFASFTRSVFSKLVQLVNDWGIPPTTTVMSSSLWTDIISSDDFTVDFFSPVTNWELLQEGQLGTMFGTTMITDHFRQANQRVLSSGEIYVVGAPVNHGVITIRGDMTAKPIDKNSDGQPAEGWFFDQITSVTMANAKSVAVGRKV